MLDAPMTVDDSLPIGLGSPDWQPAVRVSVNWSIASSRRTCRRSNSHTRIVSRHSSGAAPAVCECKQYMHTTHFVAGREHLFMFQQMFRHRRRASTSHNFQNTCPRFRVVLTWSFSMVSMDFQDVRGEADNATYSSDTALKLQAQPRGCIARVALAEAQTTRSGPKTFITRITTTVLQGPEDNIHRLES